MRWFMLLLVAFTAPALADSAVLLPQPVGLTEPLQRAILAFDGRQQVMVLETSFEAEEAAQLVRVVPLPSEPSVSAAPEECFTELERLASRHHLVYLRRVATRAGDGPATAGVTVQSRQQLAGHDLTVVHVKDSADLQAWWAAYFQGQKVRALSPKETELLVGYVRRGYPYLVIDRVQLEPGSRAIKPLAYQFKTPRLYYPLRTSNLVGGQGTVELAVVTRCTDTARRLEEASVALAPPVFGRVVSTGPFQVTVPAWLGESDLSRLHPDLATMFPGGAALQCFQRRAELQHSRDLEVELPQQTPAEVRKEAEAYSLPALHQAVRRGDRAAVESLAAQPEELKAVDRCGHNAAEAAAEVGAVELLERLLQAGLDGRGALDVAAQFGQLEACRYLVETAGLRPDSERPGWTCLHYAAAGGHTDVCRYLIERQLVPPSSDGDLMLGFETPGEIAEQHGHVETARLLKAQGYGP